MVVQGRAGHRMLGQCRSAIVDQRGAEAAAAEITGEDDVYRRHLDRNIRVIPDKPRSGADPESIIGLRALRWIPGPARNDGVSSSATHPNHLEVKKPIASPLPGSFQDVVDEPLRGQRLLAGDDGVAALLDRIEEISDDGAVGVMRKIHDVGAAAG